MEIISADEKGLQRAVELLRAGGIGAFPTDTVYGLGARIDSETAIKKIFKAKGRSQGQPLPILIADAEQLRQIAAQIPPLVWKLVERLWPGGLTIVLPKAPQISELISAGGDSVGIRLPKHPVPVALIRGLGIPIIGTSANLSGQPSPVTAKEVIDQFGERLDFVIDGGRCPGGKESTIIDLTQQPPRILREGAIPRKEIEKLLKS
ncbi:MAG: L-threonylcarbamoyladenylate synthase [Dehalococcoidia bacterium]|nr:L-threonylcarbamoyladenylate synthase [Dehalococcoidia bacterium]